MKKQLQKAPRKISGDLIAVKNGFPDTISFWIEAYFGYEVTTSVSSQKVQKRDLALFRDFMIDDCGREDRSLWSPRLSKAFADHLKKKNPAKGRGGYSDRTVNRILAHLKTLAKWIHKLRPFPLGNPMAKTKLMPIGNGLEIERAISPAERRRILMGIRFLGRGYLRSKIMWPKKDPPILKNGNRRRCFFRRQPTPTATVVSTPG
jgi:hypothetical protein